MTVLNPEISIVVPLYNSSLFIAECIDSILAQDFQNFELILIDDNSTDDTVEICNKYLEDKRVRLFTNGRKGVSSARNLGISKSQSIYITFIDSDDVVAKSFLRELIDIAKAYPDHLAMCRYIKFSETTPNFDTNRAPVLTEIPSNTLLTNIFYYHSSAWGCLFRTDLIKTYNIKMDESASFNEDIYFTCKYVSICKGGMTSSNKLYGYRINPKGLGANKRHSDLTTADVNHRSKGYFAFQDALKFCKKHAPEKVKAIDIGYSFIAAEVILTATRANTKNFGLKKNIKSHLSLFYCLRYLRNGKSIYHKLLVLGVFISPTAVKFILDDLGLLEKYRKSRTVKLNKGY